MKIITEDSEAAAFAYFGCGVRTLDDEEEDDGVDEGCWRWLWEDCGVLLGYCGVVIVCCWPGVVYE